MVSARYYARKKKRAARKKRKRGTRNKGKRERAKFVHFAALPFVVSLPRFLRFPLQVAVRSRLYQSRREK